jgi:hypothetical protein
MDSKEEIPVKKYAHRYEYLRNYYKKKYHENEEYRLAKIEKVKKNYYKKKGLLELQLKAVSLQII